MLRSVQPGGAALSFPAGRPETRCRECDDDGFFGRYVTDMVALSHFVGAGQLYKMGAQAAEKLKAVEPPLTGAPNVRMERPLVIVPGWTTRPDKFDHLVARLTDGGRNGGQAYYVRDGQVYLDKECSVPTETVPPEARVFIAVFHDVLQPPDETAPQIRRSLETIASLTGSQKVDSIGYSLGGLATRVYLDQGGEAMGRVMLLGTPNHGTRFARLGCRIVQRDIQWAMSLANLSAAHLPALEWMGALDPEGEENPQLADLNRRWSEQQSRAEAVLQVGGKDMITPSSGLWPMARGDGLVEVSSLDLPGLETRLLPGEGYKHHGNLPHDRDVYEQMIAFFGWAPD